MRSIIFVALVLACFAAVACSRSAIRARMNNTAFRAMRNSSRNATIKTLVQKPHKLQIPEVVIEAVTKIVTKVVEYGINKAIEDFDKASKIRCPGAVFRDDGLYCGKPAP